eukprot:TRINITY_DN1128_c0_g1_i1.p1 TRINITY_DN1128_c0_g1~~TRINITY_DN1128_c0_g1_i1.p1  ORF type:complete len:480 (-),score=139.43 TRINITY_DN1128_c0_g1_i1:79-1518(-)
MKATMIVVLVAMIACLSYAQEAPITADGFDTIYLDYPSWVSELHIAPDNQTMYLFGETTVRIVTGGENSFTVQDLPYTWNMPFVDVVAFFNGSSLWAVGPVLPNQYGQAAKGMATSIGFGGPVNPGQSNPIRKQQTRQIEGMSLSSVAINSDSFPVLTAYFSGWLPSANTTTDTNTYFGLIRAATDLNTSLSNMNSAFFTVDPVKDVLRLYPNSYVPFTQEFHPWIFDLDGVNIYVVNPTINWNVFPAQYEIFHIVAGTNLTLNSTAQLPAQINSITSAFMYGTSLVIGASGVGTDIGTIYILDLLTLSIETFAELPQGYSSPKALAVDESTMTLYVATNGGGGVLSYSIASGKLTGMAVLPAYLQNVWEARVGDNHLYLVTYEQQSKVFRVAKTDFCPSACPTGGFCKTGVCMCPDGYSVSDNGQQCSPNPVIQYVTKKEKGGEVALGILFMISTIAAAVLGYLYYKASRGGSYTRVL